MRERVIIEKYFSPLSNSFKDSLSLKDDAALLRSLNNENYVLSVDNFIHGTHCPLELNPKLGIVRAVLCANSDLSAMAAKPYCMFLSLSLPKKISNLKIEEIAIGLKNALKLTNMKLGGGDLCSYNGPLAYNITVVGKVNKNGALRRNTAKVGNLLLVTGALGESKIGLDCLLSGANNNYLGFRQKNKAIKRFLTPPILNKFSFLVRQHVTACIDTSDGLIEDVGKIAEYSNCGVRISSELLPITGIIKKALMQKKYSLTKLLSSGDDYELAFSANKNKVQIIKRLAFKHKIKITVIGEFIKEKGVFLDLKKVQGGYSH